MGEEEVKQISQIIYKALTSFDNQQILNRLKEEVGELVKRFPLYPDIEI